ncbi:unnamed protein product [Prorocentrum cordatum]|uniref:Uncharacterized protein n=1 Tax=Prorocentrum cordatum TaxID=2364126 RepID=A0ABN9W344_9DINO|nr:unnamed protein product [Polarella glacialis]
MVHSGCGAAWAAASARTLARRLRRERRREVGETRATALAWRTAALRRALAAHWQLADRLGAHAPKFGETVAAARLIGLEDGLQEVLEDLALGNWARHAPPPGQERFRPPPEHAKLQDEIEVGLSRSATPYWPSRPPGCWAEPCNPAVLLAGLGVEIPEALAAGAGVGTSCEIIVERGDAGEYTPPPMQDVTRLGVGSGDSNDSVVSSSLQDTGATHTFSFSASSHAEIISSNVLSNPSAVGTEFQERHNDALELEIMVIPGSLNGGSQVETQVSVDRSSLQDRGAPDTFSDSYHAEAVSSHVLSCSSEVEIQHEERHDADPKTAVVVIPDSAVSRSLQDTDTGDALPQEILRMLAAQFLGEEVQEGEVVASYLENVEDSIQTVDELYELQGAVQETIGMLIDAGLVLVARQADDDLRPQSRVIILGPSGPHGRLLVGPLQSKPQTSRG